MTLRDIYHIRYRRLLFSVNEHFLSDSSMMNADINYFIQHKVNINNSLGEFYTLLIDLESTEQLIWNNIYHRTRSEINSFLKNTTFEYKLHVPTNQDLKVYIQMYNRFARHKEIRPAETFRLNAYNKAGILAVSYIKSEHKYMCLNFYRVTKERATNIYSFTFKHSMGEYFNSTVFGRAHRALHWLDIKEFKRLGVRKYDFCGWYNGKDDIALLNINKFKEQFTKALVKEYSGVIYKNIFLRLLKKLKQ